jgi:hypothetical protein
MNAPMTLAPTWKRLCWTAGLLLMLMGAARAQDIDATAMIRGGLQVIQMIDTGNTAELWDGAAPGAKKRVTRPDFIRQVTQARTPLGVPQQRTWVAVNRQAVKNEDPDLAGQYVSIEYETRFANRTSGSARELITFHLDSDGTWRFSGYVVR